MKKNNFLLILILLFHALCFAEPQLVVQEWHSGIIKRAMYSSDGKYLLSVSENELKIWELSSGCLIRTIDDIGWTEGVQVSPSENVFICQLKNDDIVLRDFCNNTTKIIVKNAVSGRFAFSADGKLLAVAYKKGFVSVFNTKTWEKFFSLQTNFTTFLFHEIKFSDNNSFLVANGYGHTSKPKGTHLICWDLSDGKIVRSSKFNSSIDCFDISPDEKYIALGIGRYSSGTDDNLMIIQNLRDGKNLNKVKISSKYSELISLKFFSELLKNQIYLGFNSSGSDEIVEVRDYLSGEKKDFKTPNYMNEAVGFYPENNSFIVVGNKIEIRDLSDGSLIKSITRNSDMLEFSYQRTTGNLISYGRGVDENGTAFESISVLDSDFSQILSSEDFKQGYMNPCAIDDGIYHISNSGNLALYNYMTGKSLAKLPMQGINYSEEFSSSKTGNIIAYATNDDRIVIKKQNDKTFMKFIVPKFKFYSADIKVSPCGNFIEVYSYGNSVIIYDNSGKELRKMQSMLLSNRNGVFSSDDRYYAVPREDGIDIYETKKWKIEKTLNRAYVSDYYSARFSNDTKLLAVEHIDRIDIYDFQSLKKLIQIKSQNISDYYFSSDNSKIICLDYGNVFHCYSVSTGKLLSSTIINSSGEWLTYTPEGYCNGSEPGMKKFVYIVDGMDVFPLEQFSELFYRPDLVAAKLRGEDISEKVDISSIESIISTGEPPFVSFVNPPTSSKSRDITVNFSVQDMGGGFGSVYLKINGKVIQIADGSRKLELEGGTVSNSQKSNGKTTQFSHLLSLQNGENTIEAYATNSAGKIESRHAVTKISWQGVTAKPNLYVLAVGVNKYRDRSLWLNYAVPDATSIADQFRSVKGNLYQSVNVTSIFDENVTADGISSAFNSLASKVSADDVFIFYLSGHGTTHTDGDYYFIPVDFRFRNAQSVPESAISKHFITENLSKIKAQKSLVMLDTCNSGAFISTGARGMAEKTAIDRLSRATGQATIAASSDTQSAMEGYEGHGIFTYVILEGLAGKADSNGDGFISLSELSSYAEEKVPDYSYAKWGYEQYPQIDLRKQSNFPLVGK